MLAGDQPNGVIYRVNIAGAHWVPALVFPNGIVFDIIETPDHILYAVTGWNGQIFASDNDGAEWHEVAAAPVGTYIYTIMQAMNGELYIGGEAPDQQGFIRKSVNGIDWMPTEGLDDAKAVYDLMEMPGRFLAAVRGRNSGWVYQLLPDPPVWTRLTEFPDGRVRAVHCLTRDEAGLVYAGVEMELGPASTTVFQLSPENDHWQTFGGEIDLANTTFIICPVHNTLFAGTGVVYGNIYRYDFATGVKMDESANDRVPEKCDLSLNYPNPFNACTRINFQVACKTAQEHVTIRIYDILGRQVSVLADENKKPGYYSLVWYGTNVTGKTVASGIYFCRMRAGDFVKTVKVVVSK
jgi:hypothetical protein